MELLQEDIKFWRETEERRAQENRERLMIPLLERMLNKYIIDQEETVGEKNGTLKFLNLFLCHIVSETTKFL